MRNLLLFLALSLASFCSLAQPVPAAAQQKPVLILGGTLHTGTGKKIENAYVVFDKGRITAVGESSTFSGDKSVFGEIINASGKHIYPGFIAMNSTLGLNEVESVRATSDFAETGNFNPNVRSLVAYNTDSKIIPTVRFNGVLLCQPTPRFGTIPGTSCLVQLDAWNWEDAVVKADDGVHLTWPRIISAAALKENEKEGGADKPGPYEKSVQEIQQFFSEAVSYANSKPAEKNVKLEAMRNVLNGSSRLYIRVNDPKEILDVLAFIRENKIGKPVLVGVKNGGPVLDRIAAQQVPVMAGRTHELPSRNDESVDSPYAFPSRLQKSGLLFCIQNEGDMEAMNARNLPFLAGTAVAYGLPYEDAVAAISLNAAKIAGIEKDYGSIEPGKSATLFVSSGDALDMRGNNVEYAFIQGRKIKLETSQKDQYNKYMDKYGLSR